MTDVADRLQESGVTGPPYMGADQTGPEGRIRIVDSGVVGQEVAEPEHEALSGPLGDWWEELARQDIAKTVPKAQAYGSKGEDLISVGRQLAELAEKPPPEGVDPEQYYAELGVYFYIIGKLSRAAEAFRIGKIPSDDTVFDIRIYSIIWQRIRDTGHWG